MKRTEKKLAAVPAMLARFGSSPLGGDPIILPGILGLAIAFATGAFEKAGCNGETDPPSTTSTTSGAAGDGGGGAGGCADDCGGNAGSGGMTTTTTTGNGGTGGDAVCHPTVEDPCVDQPTCECFQMSDMPPGAACPNQDWGNVCKKDPQTKKWLVFCGCDRPEATPYIKPDEACLQMVLGGVWENVTYGGQGAATLGTNAYGEQTISMDDVVRPKNPTFQSFNFYKGADNKHHLAFENGNEDVLESCFATFSDDCSSSVIDCDSPLDPDYTPFSADLARMQ